MIFTYLIGKPNMRRAIRLLDLFGRAIFLIFEQKDDSMYWFGQNGKSIIVNAKDLMNSEMANTDVFENSSKERLSLCKSYRKDRGAR
jgi:hypothetical protein